MSPIYTLFKGVCKHMNTLKRFIHYYKPYQVLFYLDLICAAVISTIDLLYPQILRSLTNTLFTGDPHLL